MSNLPSRPPAEEDYIGMIRFKKSSCGDFVTDHHLHLQDIHVSFSDRQLDVYANQFIGHQVPKKDWQASRESTFLQFSRRYQQGELKTEKSDTLLMEIYFDEDAHDYDKVEECVTKANYYFMTKDGIKIINMLPRRSSHAENKRAATQRETSNHHQLSAKP